MNKLDIRNREGVAVFAGCFDDGSVRLFKDNREGQGIQARVILEEKILGNGGIKSGSKKTSGKGAARKLI